MNIYLILKCSGAMHNGEYYEDYRMLYLARAPLVSQHTDIYTYTLTTQLHLKPYGTHLDLYCKE